MEAVQSLELSKLAVPFRTGVLGSRCTTYAIGGAFEAFAEIESAEQLATLVSRANDLEIPVRVLGAGSNLLVSSEGLAGLTIRLGRAFRYSVWHGEVLHVGAAMSLMALSRETAEQGFAGLEFAGGIPASIGGAVVMNAGAHGGECAEVLSAVTVILPNGRRERIPASELRFSYRHSELPRGALVIEAELKLIPGDSRRIGARRAECLAERKARQPLTLPSAGSVFRNPSPERSAGFLIEQAGLKGVRLGGASISTLHANWIVNEARAATHHDVLALIARCQEVVREQFGVELVPEVVVWE